MCFLADETKEFNVIFSPDHPSENYADELLININGEVSVTMKFFKLMISGVSIFQRNFPVTI